MTRVLAVANQKGGVGKTTTVHTLGAALARDGLRVLLVDLDPQACLTYSVGLDPETLPRSLHDVLVGRAKAADALVLAGDVSVLPAAIDLAGSEVHLVGRVGREHAVGRALDPVKDDYDVVLLDCPPSLGILTINGLTAADFVLVPLQCETLSHRGVGQLLETVADVRAYTQPGLSVLGAVATMFDGRTRHTREVLADVEARYGLPVLEPMIPRSIRFAEAPATGQSILGHAPSSVGAVAYRELATTVTRMLAP
jgi:chromosome partitioning protein